MGAIAPGYKADLIVLDDLGSVALNSVLKAGRWSSEIELSPGEAGSISNSIRAAVPGAQDLIAPAGSVHVIGVDEGKIITRREVMDSAAPGVARLSVLERYGRGSRPSNGYVHGFGNLSGAIASSVGHDSHNLIVVGSDLEDMRVALASLIEVGGGFSVVQRGRVLERLPLPIGGLMSDREPVHIKLKLLALKKASRAIGCGLSEPFLQLAFLSLPVIPSLKLTDRGLVDVDRFEFIDVRAS